MEERVSDARRTERQRGASGEGREQLRCSSDTGCARSATARQVLMPTMQQRGGMRGLC